MRKLLLLLFILWGVQGMAQYKVTQYPDSVTILNDSSWFDVSRYDSAGYYTTAKMRAFTLKAYVDSVLYADTSRASDTLTGNIALSQVVGGAGVVRDTIEGGTLDSALFGSNSFVITTDGRVGVGVASPSSTFEVVDLIKFNDTLSSTALGDSTLLVNTTGTNMTAVGYHALQSNTTGISNTAIGANALRFNISGKKNTAIGNYALNVSTSDSNTAVGSGAMRINTSGSANTALGSNTLDLNTTGSFNVAIGNSALNKNSSGRNNVAVGWHALYSNQTTKNNVAIGYNALSVSVADSNTAVGTSALSRNISGKANAGFGSNTLQFNTTGYYNIAVGSKALQTNLTGYYNVAIGYNALTTNSTGIKNTAIGNKAGLSCLGDSNIFLGFAAGMNETGSNTFYLANTSTTRPLMKGTFNDSSLTVYGSLLTTNTLNYFEDTSITAGNNDYGIVDARIIALTVGQVYTIKMGVANTGGATLKINGLTAKAITKASVGAINTALAASDISAGQMVQVVYDGTQFQIISRLAQ